MDFHKVYSLQFSSPTAKSENDFIFSTSQIKGLEKNKMEF